MKDGEVVVLLALGLVALKRSVDWGDVTAWRWPLPAVRLPDGSTYPAVISDGIGTARPNGRTHAGVDLCYRRRSAADRALYPPGTSGGTRGFFAPPRVPVVAARAGTVWSVERTPRGIMVVLDHGAPWSSLYQHLATSLLPAHRRGVSVATGQPTKVQAGDVIGLMGADPMQGPRAFRHVHFEVHHHGEPVDPAPSMAQWPRVMWTQGVV